MATLLKERGYTARAVVSTAVLKGEFGFERGFDLYDDFSVFLQCNSEFFAERKDNPQSYNRLVTARATTRTAIQFLEKQAKHPFFLFLHYWDCHEDYLPPKPYNRMFDSNYAGPINGTLDAPAVRPEMDARDLAHLVALYDGESRWIDDNVGQILDALKALGWDNQCVVILTSDHGEEFFEHGDKDHANSLFEESTRVPLIVRWPARLPVGVVVDSPVSGVDVFATVCDLAGVRPPAGTQGRSLVPLASAEAMETPRPIFAYLNYNKRLIESVREGPVKLIFDRIAGRYSLYNLELDPEEKRSVLTEETDVARRLVRLLDNQRKESSNLIAELGLRPPSSPLRLADETIQQLRGMGYLKQ